MSANEPVTLRLVDREFLIACAPEEREGLLDAASYLDRKMRELKANLKAPSFERLAVLAAISMTHDFLVLRQRNDAQEQRLGDGLAALRAKLDAVLDGEPGRR